MALQKMNPGVNDDDDDIDLEALRNAALQTLRKTCPPPSISHAQVSQPPMAQVAQPLVAPVQPMHQGRGVPMRGRGKRGNRHGGTFRGNAHGFFNSRPPKIPNLNSNPNLITIVPQALPGEEDQNCTNKLDFKSAPRLVRPQDTYMNKNVGQKDEPKTNGVFTKFSRLREDSDSEESSGDECNENEAGSDNEQENNDAGDISESEDDNKIDENLPSDSEKDTDVMTLKADDDDEDSLEKLIQKLDEEINKPTGVVPITPDAVRPKLENVTPKREAITPKPKKDKVKKKKKITKVETKDSIESTVIVSQSVKEEPVTPTNDYLPVKLERISPDSAKEAVTVKSGKVSPVRQGSGLSPQRYSRSPVRLRSPRSRTKSPLRDRSISPRAHLSRTRSPLRMRSPPRTRSPIRRSRTRSRSRPRSPRRRSLNARPLRRSPSPWLARSPPRSPRRSPPDSRSPYRVRSPYRPRSRTPRRSRSPRPRSPLLVVSPSRPRTPLRSRSPVRARSPVRSRSPVRLRSPRRSRSPVRPRSPRRSRSPVRHVSPLRRRSPYKRTPPRLLGGPVRSPVKWRCSRSRSPPPRSYARSRTRSPPRRRSRTPSPGRHYAAPRPRPRSPVREVRSRSPVVRLRSKSPPRQYSPVPRRKSPSPQRRRRSPSPRRSPRRYVTKSPTTPATWSPNAAKMARSPVRHEVTPPSSVNVAESIRSPRPELRISPVRINRSPKPRSRTRKSVSPRGAGSPAAPAHSPSPRPSKETISPAPKLRSPSLSLSPSPDRKEISPLRVVTRRSEGFEERKWPRAEQKRRKIRPEDNDPAAPKQKRRSKKEKKKKEKKSKRSDESILEARRRKFESKGLVDVSSKKIRLKASPPKEEGKETKQENSAMAKNVNPFDEYVDESILDAEFEDLYSSDEEVDGEQKAESVASSKEGSEDTQTVFTCTLNPSSSGSEKENSVHGGDSPIDDHKRSDSQERSIPGDEDEGNASAKTGPTTNWELKEMVMKQAKGSSDPSRPSKRRVTGGSNADLDLRAELSRRRAERMNMVGALRDMMPTRLVQSAFKEVGVKTRVNGRISPEERENRGGDGRRVMLIKRQRERLVSGESPFKIAPPKEAPNESSSVKLKVPIHMRLGLGNSLIEERGRDRDRRDQQSKVKSKRNVTLTRHKQVLYETYPEPKAKLHALSKHYRKTCLELIGSSRHSESASAA